MKRDYYDVLGVSEFANADFIKGAYRRLAMKYHPDREGGDVLKFKEVAEAYDVLSDEQKRHAYDQNRNTNNVFNPAGVYNPPPDFFKNYAKSRSQTVLPGRDININASVHLKHIFNDHNLTVDFTRTDLCNVCSGKGVKIGRSKSQCDLCKGSGTLSKSSITRENCSKCNGSGLYPSVDDMCDSCQGMSVCLSDHVLVIKVPKGIESGKSIVFRGEGHVGTNGGRRGDLYIKVDVVTDSFIRDKDNPANISLVVFVPYWKLVLGGEHNITVPDGSKISVTVPKQCQNGHTERVKGAGLPIYGRSDRGELKITFAVETPNTVTPEFISLIEKMRELEIKTHDV